MRKRGSTAQKGRGPRCGAANRSGPGPSMRSGSTAVRASGRTLRTDHSLARRFSEEIRRASSVLRTVDPRSLDLRPSAPRGASPRGDRHLEPVSRVGHSDRSCTSVVPAGPASSSGCPSVVALFARSSVGVHRSLFPTRHTLTDAKPQVKRVFAIPRVVPRSGEKSPGIHMLSTGRPQGCAQVGRRRRRMERRGEHRSSGWRTRWACSGGGGGRESNPPVGDRPTHSL
jgi:hypothetical protein